MILTRTFTEEGDFAAVDAANEAFVVRAVNAHDELLLAAKEAALVIVALAKTAGFDPRKGTCFPRLMAAIAKAEGK